MNPKIKHIIFIALFPLIYFWSDAQDITPHTNNIETVKKTSSFKEGEWLKFRIHFGPFNAGFATVQLKKTQRAGQTLYHAVSEGWTTGVARLFYKVNDRYESYFTTNTIKPIEFVRRVNEDGYLIERNLYFDHRTNKVTIKDHVKKTKTQVVFKEVQDMVSSFYYLRNTDISNAKPGDNITVILFFDSKSYPLKLLFLKREILKTKFGKIKTWRIRPLVEEGGIFKKKESLTVWVSDDDNKLPIRIKADLTVGSLKADLKEFKGLAHTFKVHIIK